MTIDLTALRTLVEKAESENADTRFAGLAGLAVDYTHLELARDLLRMGEENEERCIALGREIKALRDDLEAAEAKLAQIHEIASQDHSQGYWWDAMNEIKDRSKP